MAGGKVAVVTGTSSGIGLHTAVGLARKGVRVVAPMRDTTKSDRLLAEAAEHGVGLTVRRLDVTDRDGARRCLDEVTAELGYIDILINNAGRVVAGPFGAARRCRPAGHARRQLPWCRRPDPDMCSRRCAELALVE